MRATNATINVMRQQVVITRVNRAAITTWEVTAKRGKVKGGVNAARTKVVERATAMGTQRTVVIT